ncbi:MAG: hypothetical protein WAU56_07405 [Steroidobacteraceae bacterium]
MALRVQEVFTPGSFPSKTYIQRPGALLEQSLRDAIDTPGLIVSLIGPSKSGKTVLVEKVVGIDALITITGVGITSPEDIWSRVLDWMEAPAATERTASTSGSVSFEGKAEAHAKLPLIGEAKAGGSAGAEVSHERGKSSTFERGGLAQVVDVISKSEYVVLVDDFHYMPREVQSEAAKSLKEAVRLGVKICTAAVVHRGDDLVRANPELRGRVRAVDLKYWPPTDLRQIAIVGFNALNVEVSAHLVDTLAQEAAGSPQLMQLLCLQACYVLDIRERGLMQRKVEVSEAQQRTILEQTSSATDFRSLIDVLDAGPKTRGQERKVYPFRDGSSGDVYRAILKGVAGDPPRLSFNYEDLLRRTAAVCKGESPSGSSVVGTCLHMSRLAQEKFPRERAIDWDEQKQILDIPDPYLLFYLRWSGRLSEAE